MTESQLFNLIKKKDKFRFLQRVENSIDLGTPDVFYINNEGYQGWMELKVINDKVKNRKIVSPKWRPGQMAWARKYSKSADSITWYLIIAINNDIYITPEISKTYKMDDLEQVHYAKKI